MTMQIHTRLTSILRNTPDLIRKLAYTPSRGNAAESADNLKRELYGMNLREQSAVKQVMSRTGQAVTVREPTIAFDKKNTSTFLEKGSQMKISKHPLRLDENGNVRVVLLDQGNKYIFLRLSDYIASIHASQ
jgi:hypothetical protein